MGAIKQMRRQSQNVQVSAHTQTHTHPSHAHTRTRVNAAPPTHTHTHTPHHAHTNGAPNAPHKARMQANDELDAITRRHCLRQFHAPIGGDSDANPSGPP